MIKGFVILFNLIGLFLCRLFFPVSVTVSQTAPATAELNNSFLVQVAINKDDLNGIAKFTEQLPAGLTAVPIDNEGAKTSFNNNTIQFSWDSLPASGILNISFRVDVTPSAAVQGDLLIGRFLYTVSNQKLEADGDPSNITITNAAGVQASNTVTPTSNTTQANSTQQPNAQTLQISSTSSGQIENIYIGLGGVFIIRQFPSLSISPNTDADITLVIHKANITGFAKIEDSIPEGFTANATDVNGASFTFVNNLAKFVWQNVPSDSIITVSYRLSAGPVISGIYSINGDFSYIYNGSPAICSTGSTSFETILLLPDNTYSAAPPTPLASNNITAPITTQPIDTANNQPATNMQSSTPPVQNIATPIPVADAPIITANSTYKAMDTTNALPNPVENITPSISAPSTGITYRVQIMALHKPVNIAYFSSKKKLKVSVNTEVDGGFTKYTVGNYNDYKSVRDAREDLKNKNIKDPFVVCYNSGVRITVQEALMISHQQWYK